MSEWAGPRPTGVVWVRCQGSKIEWRTRVVLGGGEHWVPHAALNSMRRADP